MFELYDKVKIKSKNLIGTIVDIATIKGEKIITVESDTESAFEGGYGKMFPLFDCTENDLERI